MKPQPINIIAGPCSIDEDNIQEIYEIAGIIVKNRNDREQRAVKGTRIVGLKSRSEFEASGEGMGIDAPAYTYNMQQYLQGRSIDSYKIPPSVNFAAEIVRKTGLEIWSEVMSPLLQLPLYEGRIPAGKLLAWNPAVNQLGWTVLQGAAIAQRNGWKIGLKNPKWIGDHWQKAEAEEFTGETTLEKTWKGMVSYARGKSTGIQAGTPANEVILIQRGADVPDKIPLKFRNMPVHNIAKRVKQATGCNLYFDPSHAYGPAMKEAIIPAVIAAMKMQLPDNTYLYDGILIETGTSKTDTGQHITIDELRYLATELAKTRDLGVPI